MAHDVTVGQVHLLKFDFGHLVTLFGLFSNALGEDSQVLEVLDVDI